MEIRKTESISEKYTVPVVLSIAGSDSSGGAGIQADIRVISHLGCYAMTVLTAVTAQNTFGITNKLSLSGKLIVDQLTAVIEDIKPNAVKIGMLPDPATSAIIAEILRKYNLSNIVIDPILSSTSGTLLSDKYFTTAEILYGMADILTPNLPEASALLGKEVKESRDDRIIAAKMLMKKYGCKSIYLKGGHTELNECRDIFITQTGEISEYISPRIETVNTHGTGCVLSSALASFLALGYAPGKAAEKAHSFVYSAIRKNHGHNIGHGHGPLLFNISNLNDI